MIIKRNWKSSVHAILGIRDVNNILPDSITGTNFLLRKKRGSNIKGTSSIGRYVGLNVDDLSSGICPRNVQWTVE